MADQLHEILIVGAGSIGERHLRCFRATERVNASFVEPRTELAEQISARYPGSRAFSSLAEALEQQWSAAVIATPAPLHIPQATELIKRGSGVLIEKPLSVGLEDVDELIAAAHQENCPVAVAYVYRAHPVLTEMREVLMSGRLGKPVELIAYCGQNFPTYRPAYAQTYYVNRRSGGGAVQDALTHILNAGEWLLGPVDRVVADIGHLMLPDVEVEDTAHVLARHGDIMACYALNQHQAPNESTITVVCERGTLRFEVHHCRWRMMEHPDDPWIDSSPITLERDTLFTRQANAFLDLIEGQAEPLCTLEEAASTLRANLAILESAETSAWRSTRNGRG